MAFNTKQWFQILQIIWNFCILCIVWYQISSRYDFFSNHLSTLLQNNKAALHYNVLCNFQSYFTGARDIIHPYQKNVCTGCGLMLQIVQLRDRTFPVPIQWSGKEKIWGCIQKTYFPNLLQPVQFIFSLWYAKAFQHHAAERSNCTPVS